jgi:hypothetical protein
MSRELAVKLWKIYILEKDYNRGIYPDELRSHGICTKHEISSLIDALKKDCALIETNVQGANTYTVSNIGKAHIESYLDLKREM